jgi:NADPH-dependent glutamate synthase beta subunit-like oxidoreductase
MMCDPMSLEDARKEADRCLLCQDAPCSEGCPAGTNPGKFIRQIKFENFKGAARTIRNNNPLGSVCSLVCPRDQLCEKECSVKALEDPINIGGLQRFAVEYGKQNSLESLEKSAQNKGNKIAVIGAGPAGIGCAAELAKMGYDVTIFEKEKEAGGVVKWGIPAYRLSDDFLAYDLKNLLDLGVAIKYNSPVMNKDDLSKDYKAVFIAGGMDVPFELPILKGYSNVINSTQLLRTAKVDKNNIKFKDKTVAVIGGGSVAMDAACTAAALGAKKVYAISLEGLSELPADSEEIEIAHTMHVIFKANSQITEVVAKDKVIVGLKGKEIEWIKPNNFSPNNVRQIDGTEFNLKVDFVVQAIGAKPNAAFANFASGLKTSGKGTIVVDENYATNIPGVFAGGDIANGGATVVLAVGEGKKAAASIDKYINSLAK